jgi:Mg-chelatase subunit ChlD
MKATLVALLAACSTVQGRTAEAEEPLMRRIEVVFVLDTTGSMSSLLAAAQEQIWSIATALACAQPAPELRLGLVAFRDRKDAYVTRVTDLTTDMDALYTELVALRAEGGGDEAESVNQGLYEAVTRVDWSTDPDTYRVIFVVGDAPPHMDYADDVEFAASCRLARQRGIAVNSIQCGRNERTTPVWAEIARLGDGVFSRLDENVSRREVTTPYDNGIASMARQLDATRLPYGNDAERAAAARRGERSASIHEGSSMAAQADRALFNVTAAGRRNVYGDKDLLGDVQRGVTKLEDVREDLLPESLRALSTEERRARLQRQAKVREDLELTIQMFAARRDDYLAEHGAEERGLRSRLLAAMEPQAARRGFKFGGCASAPR